MEILFYTTTNVGFNFTNETQALVNNKNGLPTVVLFHPVFQNDSNAQFTALIMAGVYNRSKSANTVSDLMLCGTYHGLFDFNGITVSNKAAQDRNNKIFSLLCDSSNENEVQIVFAELVKVLNKNEPMALTTIIAAFSRAKIADADLTAFIGRTRLNITDKIVEEVIKTIIPLGIDSTYALKGLGAKM